MRSNYFSPEIVKQHQKAIYVYGTLDRERAAFIQALAEKDATQNKYDDDEKN